MKTNKTYLLIASLIVSIGLQGCAMLFTGTNAMIQVQSNPAGAQVAFNDKVVGQTPLYVVFDKTKEPVIITLNHDSIDRAKKIELEKKFNAASLFDVFLLFPLNIYLDWKTQSYVDYRKKFFYVNMDDSEKPVNLEGHYYVITDKQDTFLHQGKFSTFHNEYTFTLIDGTPLTVRRKNMVQYKAASIDKKIIKRQGDVHPYVLEYRPVHFYEKEKNREPGYEWVNVLFFNDEYRLLSYYEVHNSNMPSGAGGMPTTFSSVYMDLFVYKGDELVEKVTDENYRKVLTRYFGDCVVINQFVSKSKKYDPWDLIKLKDYERGNCYDMGPDVVFIPKEKKKKR